MMPDIERNTLGTVLVALAVLLFILPTLFPVGAVLAHDTGDGTRASRAELTSEGVQVFEYDNLSARAQKLYRQTLRSGGEYTVPAGQGAPEFPYPTDGIRRFAIVRPADASGLPPADEPTLRIEEQREELNESKGTPSQAQLKELERKKQQVARIDLMSTHKANPDLSAPSQLLRLFSVLFAVVFAGLGGYFLASK